MSVTRLKGKTNCGTYVVTVYVPDDLRIDRIEINGKPHPSVTEICNTIGKAHTTLVADSIKAIKLTMAKHNEYRGYKID